MTLVETDVVLWLLLAAAVGAYARALAVLRRRGVSIPARRRAAGYGGLALFAFALLGPPAALADELMLAHMAEHVLMADVAAPLLLAGLRSPVLLFVAPRALLVALARRRRLRRMAGVLRRPLVALPLYVVVLGAWHVPLLFEAAVRQPLVHVLQHQSFVLISVLVWWPVLQPERAALPARLWKAGHVLAVRVPTMALAMAFVLMTAPAYGGVYDGALGLTALEDQQAAGGLMLFADVLLVSVWLALIVPAALREPEPGRVAATPSQGASRDQAVPGACASQLSNMRTFIGHEKK